jgi:2-hydroxy-3-keto-5-methylthiopentenyl-1-phosphate phosphatase
MVRIFCDFDGTVCPADVGADFFRAFAGSQARGFTEELMPGNLPIQDWIRQMCESIPSISKKEFISFIDRYSVDPHFIHFLQFVEESDAALTIVSDGLDTYIRYILSKVGLDRVIFFANRLDFVSINGNQKIAVHFPYTDAECRLCGNCKRNHMLTLSGDDDIIVYIGDGYSDHCPAKYADFVFAKGELIRHCQKQNITYFEFRHFGDVQCRLKEVFKRKRIRCRQEAAMARREVFMQG